VSFRQRPEYAQWKREVFQRKGKVCALCRETVNIEAHHISEVQKYPELAFDPDNGIPLCGNCHTKAHSSEFGDDYSREIEEATGVLSEDNTSRREVGLCPKCHFEYAWNGESCSHCGYGLSAEEWLLQKNEAWDRLSQPEKERMLKAQAEQESERRRERERIESERRRERKRIEKYLQSITFSLMFICPTLTLAVAWLLSAGFLTSVVSTLGALWLSVVLGGFVRFLVREGWFD